MPCPKKDQQGVNSVELGSLHKLLVDPCLPPQSFTDQIGCGQGKDGRRKERGIDKPEGKEIGTVFSRQGIERKGGILGRLNPDPIFEKGLCTDKDDEEGDDMDHHDSQHHVEPGKLVILDL